LGQEPGLIEEITELRRKAEAKLEERRKSMSARQKPAKAAADRGGKNSAEEVPKNPREEKPAWECPDCEASGGGEELTSGADLCPKCGYDGIRHNVPERVEEDDEG